MYIGCTLGIPELLVKIFISLIYKNLFLLVMLNIIFTSLSNSLWIGFINN